MLKVTLNIEGMKCHNCENHMNEAIRKNFMVEEVTSSHEKNETVIITKNDIDEKKISEIVAEEGYDFKGILKETYVKKGLISKIFKKIV